MCLQASLLDGRHDAEAVLAQAGIDAREREAADKLQKLTSKRCIIASRICSRRSPPLPAKLDRRQPEHAHQAIEGRCSRRTGHDLMLQVAGPAPVCWTPSGRDQAL